MKFTKIILVALSLMLFSCSPEEDVTVTSESSFAPKSSGLSSSQVSALRNQCMGFSTSPAFVQMRQTAIAFAGKFNSTPDLTSRTSLGIWLNNNLGQTTFVSTNQGLSMFDDLIAKSGVFLAANNRFFGDLSGATTGQIKVILQPIEPTTPVLPVTTSCHSACEIFFYEFIGSVIDHYISNVEAINTAANLPAEVKKANLATAEAHLQFGINVAFRFGLLCLEDCDAM